MSALQRLLYASNGYSVLLIFQDKLNARLIISRVVIEALKDLKMRYPKTTRARRRELLAICRHLAGQVGVARPDATADVSDAVHP